MAEDLPEDTLYDPLAGEIGSFDPGAERRRWACPYCGEAFLQRQGDPALGEHDWIPTFCLRPPCEAVDRVVEAAQAATQRREATLEATVGRVYRATARLERLLRQGAPEVILDGHRRLLVRHVAELCRRRGRNRGQGRPVDPQEGLCEIVAMDIVALVADRATPQTMELLAEVATRLEADGRDAEADALRTMRAALELLTAAS